ncbi:MAG: protein kinase domain-containing protein [bacterium]
MLEKFDNYQLLSKIATGGMAEIYLAKHVNSPVNSMPIAIKKVLRQYSRNTTLIKMFLAEARIICNINHDNIVKIYDFGKYDDQYFIAMEYVFGQNLGSILNKLGEKGLKMPLHLAIETFLGVLSGLEHAHNTKDKNGIFLNVVHLDMNPNNVLVSYDGKIKVVDFGIASANYTKKLKGALANIQGTYGYLSPEQCREEQIDRRSDIFSAGIILYEALAGIPLFKHLESDAAILNAILNLEIPDIRKVAPEINPKLADIIMKALEKDPKNRYATALEMREELLSIYNSLEFDPSSESLSSLLKKTFPSHFIKMTKVIERAQTEYLMEELFKDIGELEELDMKEKIRVKLEEEKELKKKEGVLPSVGKIFAITAAVAAVLVAIIFYLLSKSEAKFEAVAIFSQPPEAIIYLNGEDTGKMTPATLMLEHNKSYIIEFRKDGLIGGMEFTPSEKNREVNMVLRKR